MNRSLRSLAPLAGLFVFLALVSTWVIPGGLDAQHIQEIRPKSFEDLPVFLNRFPRSFEAWLFYALFVSALCGTLTSWIWKWSNGAADGFKHWSAKYVVQQLLFLAGQAISAIMVVGFVTDAGEFFGWLAVLYTGAVTGFGGEVKTAWSPAARAAATGGAGGGA